MKRALVAGLILGVASVSFAANANASTYSDLFSTGVDVSGGIDQAWSIVGGVSDPPHGTNAYTNATNGTFPIGPWVPNTSLSQWDTPFNPLASTTDPSQSAGPYLNGTYVFQTTFNSISGGLFNFSFAADNEVSSITLNGASIYTGPTDGSSQYTSMIPVDGNILAANTSYIMDFTVVNYAQYAGNPSGLDVLFQDGSSAPPPTPLPSTWIMMLGGLAVFGYMAFSRRKSERALAAA